MKIAIDVSPLSTGHKVRGVGFYLENLRKALLEYHPENEYIFFKRGENLPSDTDLVHFPYFDPFFLTLPFYKQLKTVVTVHDLTPLVFPEAFPRGIKGEIRWQMQKLSLRKTDAVITDSECSKADVVKIAGVKESKVKPVYLAAGEHFRDIKSETEKLTKVRRKFGLPEKFVLYVGDVTWNKNLPRLIDASRIANVPLVMVGKALASKDFDKENPWNKDLVEVQLMTEGQENIKKLGFVESEELVAIYNLATVFVMPSLYEGFGLPVLEAMACGCPVITSKEGSLKEVADNAALIVDAYDEGDMAKGIQKVFNDIDLQKELTLKGFERAKKFSWKNTALETVKVYEQVAKI